MCGRLNVTDNAAVRSLCDQLDIDLWPEQGMRFSRFIRATERLTIVFERNNQRVARNAIWWLLLEPDHSEFNARFKPSKYTSFNTRYDKLNVPRSAGYHAYRQQRCVIPVAGFGETQKIGGQLHYHDLIAAPSEPLAMGGLYREWRGQDNNGNAFTETSCSVVTLPPHPKLTAIHEKSTPLMLSANDGTLSRWLDSGTTDTTQLDDLLTPTIRHSFTVYPINKPSLQQTISETYTVEPDA